MPPPAAGGGLIIPSYRPTHRTKHRAGSLILHTRAPVLNRSFVLMSARRWAAGFLGLAEDAEKGGTVAELNLQLGKLKPQGVRWVCQGRPARMAPNGAQFAISGECSLSEIQ